MIKLAFIINSLIKGKGHFYHKLSHIIEATQLEINSIETSVDNRAIDIARQLANDGYTHLIAVGGDGTLNEVLNGIMLSDKSPQLGVLPYGTANDFIKSVKAPKDIDALIESITNDSFLDLVVGTISYQINNQTHERYFLNIADMGIGAEVVQRVNKSKKRLGSDLTFMKAIIQTFFTYKNKRIKVESDQWEWEGKINSLVIANGKYFGSGMCIAPHADPAKDLFEIVISGDISIFDYVKHVGQIKKGKVIEHPQLFYKTASQLKVTSVDNCAIECDGEYLGTAPVTVGIAQKKISFITQS
ncbi:MAG: diacylglycerol kinase family protein [Fulvivirga sp.]